MFFLGREYCRSRSDLSERSFRYGKNGSIVCAQRSMLTGVVGSSFVLSVSLAPSIVPAACRRDLQNDLSAQAKYADQCIKGNSISIRTNDKH